CFDLGPKGADVVRREFELLCRYASRMGGEVDQHGDWLAAHIIETHNSQLAVAGFWLELCVPVTIESLELNRIGPESGGDQMRVRLDYSGYNGILQLFVVPERRVESALSLAGFIDQLQNRPMVSMRPGDEREFDAGLGLDSAADFLERVFSRSAAEIQADNGQLLVAGLNHESRGLQSVEGSGRQGIVPGSIAPHWKWFFRGYVPPADSGFEYRCRRLSGRADPENKENDDATKPPYYRFHTDAREMSARRF